MEFAKEIWNKILKEQDAAIQLIDKFWERILAAYSEKGRYYHNLQHIIQMLKASIQNEAKLKDIKNIQLAIFYHDVIYKATKPDNEEKSAELAVNHLKQLGFTEKQVKKCNDYILATKSHGIETADLDLNYFLDFDLQILGATWERYEIYTKQIRQEYSIYPKPQYNKGRKKVLKHFLEQERIYKTDDYYYRFEERARLNIEQEILML